MKKYIGFIVLTGLVLSFSVASFARAEDRGQRQEDRQAFRTQLQTERKAFVDDLKTKRGAFMTEVKAKKEEWKTARTEARVAFCEKAKEMITKRFEFAITQLEKHQTRVGEIIVQLNTDGKDTTLATESLNLSKQKLADAKTKLSEVKALIPEGGCTNMTSEIFGKIKLGAREAKDLLKESREALRQAVKEIKTLKGEDNITN